MVKTTKSLSKKVGKATSSSSSSSLKSAITLECSPPKMRNGAKATSNYLLSSLEQVAFNKHRTEIKQISGLVILSCGLGIAEKKTCSQIMQENDFFSSFEKVYEKLCNDVIIGSRVKRIPLHYLNIGTGKAKELLSGKKLRKKYSAMKSYMNNILSPLWRK